MLRLNQRASLHPLGGFVFPVLVQDCRVAQLQLLPDVFETGVGEHPRAFGWDPFAMLGQGSVFLEVVVKYVVHVVQLVLGDCGADFALALLPVVFVAVATLLVLVFGGTVASVVLLNPPLELLVGLRVHPGDGASLIPFHFEGVVADVM